MRWFHAVFITLVALVSVLLSVFNVPPVVWAIGGALASVAVLARFLWIMHAASAARHASESMSASASHPPIMAPPTEPLRDPAAPTSAMHAAEPSLFAGSSFDSSPPVAVSFPVRTAWSGHEETATSAGLAEGARNTGDTADRPPPSDPPSFPLPSAEVGGMATVPLPSAEAQAGAPAEDDGLAGFADGAAEAGGVAPFPLPSAEAGGVAPFPLPSAEAGAPSCAVSSAVRLQLGEGADDAGLAGFAAGDVDAGETAAPGVTATSRSSLEIKAKRPAGRRSADSVAASAERLLIHALGDDVGSVWGLIVPESPSAKRPSLTVVLDRRIDAGGMERIVSQLAAHPSVCDVRWDRSWDAVIGDGLRIDLDGAACADASGWAAPLFFTTEAGRKRWYMTLRIRRVMALAAAEGHAGDVWRLISLWCDGRRMRVLGDPLGDAAFRADSPPYDGDLYLNPDEATVLRALTQTGAEVSLFCTIGAMTPLIETTYRKMGLARVDGSRITWCAGGHTVQGDALWIS